MTREDDRKRSGLVTVLGAVAKGRLGRLSKRGSALVVAIGSLAVIAVLAAIYVTVGEGDQASAEAVLRQQDQTGVEQRFAEHVLGVIGDDRLDTYLEPMVSSDGGNFEYGQRLVRETFDNPITDATVVSVLPEDLAPDDDTALSDEQRRDAARIRFTPSGRHTEPVFEVGSDGTDLLEDIALDLRIPSDPWLASTEPWFAGMDLEERTYSRADAGGGAPDTRQGEFFYMDNRDWPQISNVAPDGRFVNLFNLRNNFDAPQGFWEPGDPMEGLSYDPAVGEDDENLEPGSMSRNLSLLRPFDPTDPESPLQATREITVDLMEDFDGEHNDAPTLSEEIGFDPDGDGPLTDELRFEQFPVWTTMRQRHMYFPLDGRFKILPRDAGGEEDFATPGHPDFPDYQYADTDGDGMADARWFELVDASNPNRPIDLLEGTGGEDWRWFGAVRIIDLSGLVNVNTATDQLAAPDTVTPAGFSPAEVDLRRLLSLADAAMAYRPRPEVGGSSLFNERLSYRHIDQPVTFADQAAGERADPTVDNTQYVNYGLSLEDLEGNAIDLTVVAEDADDPLGGLALNPGRFGYDAIRRAIENPQPAIGESEDTFNANVGSLFPNTNEQFDLNLEFSLLSAEDDNPNDAKVGGRHTNGFTTQRSQFWLSDRSPFLGLTLDLSENDAGIAVSSFTDEVYGTALYRRERRDLPGGNEGVRYRYLDTPAGPRFAQRRYYEEIGRLDPTRPGETRPRTFGSDFAILNGGTFTERPQVNEITAIPLTFGAGLFGTADLAELLTYWGINDDAVTSRLERVTSGRYAADSDVFDGGTPASSPPELSAHRLEPDNTARFGPMRSNRPTALERDRHDNVTGYPAADPAADETQPDFIADNVIDAETFARLAVDPRIRMTTVSGASPLRRTALTGDLRLSDTAAAERSNALRGLRRERIRGDVFDSAAERRLANDPFMIADGSELLEEPNALNDVTERDNQKGIIRSDQPGDRFLAHEPDYIRADFASEARIGVPGVDLDTRQDVSDETWQELTNVADADLNTGSDAFADFDSDPDDNGILASPATLFQYYAEALMPHADVGDGWAWFMDDGTGGTISNFDERLATLHYGHVGPELALRLSAHLAVNMHDRWDEDTEPTVATLLVDGTVNNAPKGGDRFPIGTTTPTRNVLQATPIESAAEARVHPFLEWFDPPQPFQDFNADGIFNGGDRITATPLIDLRTRFDLDELNGLLKPWDVEEAATGVDAPNTPDGSYNELADNDGDGDDASDRGDDRRTLARGNVSDGLSIPDARRAVRVAGIEPQPFLTEVAAMYVFTDAPKRWLAQDVTVDSDEYSGTEPNIVPEAITINTLVDSANEDFLMQVVAFQVHNPFDVSVPLVVDEAGDGLYDADQDGTNEPASEDRDGDEDESFLYYVEFGGRFFPLAEAVGSDATFAIDRLDDGTGDQRIAFLEPGQTVVFYATAHANLNDLNGRWDDIGGIYASPSGNAQDFLDAQIGTPTSSVPAFRTVPVDPEQMPADGTSAQPAVSYGGASFQDLLTASTEIFRQGAGGGAGGAIEEARLWRAYRAPQADPTDTNEFIEPARGIGPLNTSEPVWYENDILVDRMDLEVVDSAGNQIEPLERLRDRINASGSINVPGTRASTDGIGGGLLNMPPPTSTNPLAGDPFDPPTLGTDDDFGFTFVQFASVRRPDHGREDSAGPTFQATDAPRGALPAWCIESVGRNLFATGDFDPAAANPWEVGVLGNGASSHLLVHWNFNRFIEMSVDQTNAGDGVLATIDDEPEDKFQTVGDRSTEAQFDIGVLGGDDAYDEDFRGGVRNVEGRYIADLNDAFHSLETQLTVESDRFERTAGLRDSALDALDAADDGVLNGSLDQTLTEAANLEDPISSFKLIDLLTTLAVGHVHAPWRDANLIGLDKFDVREDTTGVMTLAARTVSPGEYFTLGELMSFALGFEDFDEDNSDDPDFNVDGAADVDSYAEAFTDIGGVVRPFRISQVDERFTGILPAPINRFDRREAGYSPYFELVVPDTTPADRHAFRLDRGHLRIDAFEPFVDTDGENGLGSSVPGNASGGPQRLFEPELGDLRIGAGAPLAAGLLSNGRVFGVTRADVRTDDRVNSAQMGTVNINTASLPVLRTLPGLTPPMFHTFTNNNDDQLYRFHDFWAQRYETTDPAPFARGTATPESYFLDQGLESSVFPTVEPTPAWELWRANPDRAAMIAAYRDRTMAEFRMPSRPGASSLAGPLDFMTSGDFTPNVINPGEPRRRIDLLARNMKALPDNVGSVPPQVQEKLADRGRSLLTGLKAPREQPGFETIGELASVTIARRVDPIESDRVFPEYAETALRTSDRDEFRWENGGTIGTNGAPNDDSDAPFLLNTHTLTGLGHDIANENLDDVLGPMPDDPDPVNIGDTDTGDPAENQVDLSVFDGSAPVASGEIVTVEPTPLRSTANPTVDYPPSSGNAVPSRVGDEIPNDYDERLAVLGQLAQVVDVRSDWYAAWFKLRGYRRSDAEGLENEEPMTPTIERRFLMVIDRSGVTTPTDEPRVVMFRELPE